MNLPNAAKTLFPVLLLLSSSGSNFGQGRINDKDLENLMRNLNDDAKSFRSPFSSALKKSSIRRTSEARDAENIAASFAGQTEALLNNFKKTKKGDTQLAAVTDSASRINNTVRKYQLDPQVTARWDKIQTELSQIQSAFGMSPASGFDNSRGITPYAASNAGSCAQAVGSDRADRLVHECLQVSPATHPPCNAQNSCALIIDEIKRGCGLLNPRDRPAYCAEYQ